MNRSYHTTFLPDVQGDTYGVYMWAICWNQTYQSHFTVSGRCWHSFEKSAKGTSLRWAKRLNSWREKLRRVVRVIWMRALRYKAICHETYSIEWKDVLEQERTYLLLETAPKMLWSNCFVIASIQQFILVIRQSVTSLNAVLLSDYRRIVFA